VVLRGILLEDLESSSHARNALHLFFDLFKSSSIQFGLPSWLARRQQKDPVRLKMCSTAPWLVALLLHSMIVASTNPSINHGPLTGDDGFGNAYLFFVLKLTSRITPQDGILIH